MTVTFTSPVLRGRTEVEFDLYDGHEIGSTRVFDVEFAGDVFTFKTYTAAKFALAKIAHAAATEGIEVFPCSWGVTRTDGYEADSPADLIVDCGAPTFTTETGWECMAGHTHDRTAMYVDEDDLAGFNAAGVAVPANAVMMDGTSVR